MTQKPSNPFSRLLFLIFLPVVVIVLLVFGEAQSHGTAPAFQSPIREGHITSRFGERIHPISKKKMFHRGIDIAAETGIPVYAAAAGMVAETGYHEKAGNYILIAHSDSFATFYSQLSEILVHTGDRVTAEVRIGLVGSSGLSTGPHLHFELRLSGEYLNPEDTIDFSDLQR